MRSRVVRDTQVPMNYATDGAYFKMNDAPSRTRGRKGALDVRRRGRTALSYARVSISSRTLAMNSSTPMGTVSLVRSRTEMLPASTSFSPRMSM